MTDLIRVDDLFGDPDGDGVMTTLELGEGEVAVSGDIELDFHKLSDLKSGLKSCECDLESTQLPHQIHHQ